MANLLAAQARALHQQSLQSVEEAGHLRDQRDALIRRLRADDPATWTNVELAKAVGCSPELIFRILQGRRH